MKTKISMKHVCAFLLIFVLIFTSIPLNAIAQDADSEEPVDITATEEIETVQAINSQNDEKDSITQKEIVELRTENSKHFDMGDGTYQAVTYSYPVHRKDASGKWQEIDNTLSAQKASTSTMYATDDLRVKFASEFSSSASLVTLNENGYIIDMSFVSPSKGVVSAATVDNSHTGNKLLAADRVSENIDDPSNYNSTSTIKYKNVRTNVDLEYVLYSNDVKENIIVNGKCADYTYTFRIKLNNLAAELDDSGIVYFRDLLTSDVKYLIPLPYMYDADGNVSYDVGYQLKEIDTNTYNLIIIANAAWINSTERVFPVVIDPTISSTTGLTYDTYVNATDSTTKDTNYGYEPTMWISNLYRTTFVKSTSMPSLPSGATITDARLKIAYYYYSGVTGGMYITAHQVNKNWWETYSWNDMSNNGQDTSLGVSSTALSTTYLGSSSSYPQWASINVTNAAKSWYNGGTSASNGNYGVALKYKSGNYSVIFHSYDAKNGYTPYFTVTYTPKIEQGVYAISKQNTTSYMRCNTVNGGTYVSQQTFSTPPASESNRHAMFKIIYRAATDDYILRDMVNNEVIIYANVGYSAPLSIKMKNTSNSDIPSERAWKITATNDGYYNISCTISGTTYYMYMPSSGNLELTTDKSLSGAKWNFHKYTGETFRGWGQIGEWPEHIVNGSSATIEAYIYSTVIDENRAWFRNTAVDPDVATATRLSYSAQMTISPKYGGNTKIQIEADTGTAVFGYHYLMSGWDDGCFFIKNSHSSDYLTVSDSSTDADLTLTSLPDGSKKEYTLWKFVHWSGGYYWINQDVTGETIHGNNDTSSNLTMQPYADSAYIQNLWKFIPQSDGTIKIQSYYHAQNNPNHYMSLHEVLWVDKIRSLADTGDKQLWTIQPLIFNLNVYYDQALKTFAQSLGMSPKTYIDTIMLNNTTGASDYQNIPDAFLDCFGIHLKYNLVNSVYASYPYQHNCAKKDDPLSMCHYCNKPASHVESLVQDCQAGNHHKECNKIRLSTPEQPKKIFGSLLFCGHKTCAISNGTHVDFDGNIGGGWGSNADVFPIKFSDPKDYNCIKRVVYHEIQTVI